MAEFDVIVIGAGAMGSAALYHLARRGARALCIERFAPGHDHGSSHGTSRIIRLGYYEHPSYVPLVRAAIPLWRQLESASGRKLMHTTGIVEIGKPDGALVQGTLASSRLHGLAHELLDAREVMRRFPAFRLPSDYVGVWQPDGGWLAAEPAVQAHVALALAAGAQLRNGETVRTIEPHGGGVGVVTDRGNYTAGKVIVAAGAWTQALLPGLPVRLRVTRQAMAWFTPADPAPFAPGRFPVFMLETAHGIHYGFPLQEAGLKIAKHFHRNETADPDAYRRAVSAADESEIRAGLADFLPAANGALRAAKTCLYTMTPDGDFVVDRMPGEPSIIVASPCSGHGFKFAPVIGEILAELATESATHHDISRFRLGRFGTSMLGG